MLLILYENSQLNPKKSGQTLFKCAIFFFIICHWFADEAVARDVAANTGGRKEDIFIIAA